MDMVYYCFRQGWFLYLTEDTYIDTIVRSRDLDTRKTTLGDFSLLQIHF